MSNIATLKPNTITAEIVEQAIALFISTLSASKAAAQEAAVAALVHCYQHRDAVYLRRLLEVIEKEGKDFVRRAPFTLWLRAYAPVKMVKTPKELGGKETVSMLQFDAESKLLDNADEVIATATAKLWWTMSQDKEVGAFDLIAFDKRILGIARKAKEELEAAGNTDPAVLAHVNSIFSQFTKFVAADTAAVAKLALGKGKAAAAA